MLMRAFIAWHRERHLEDVALIERYFDQAAFEKELAELPGKFAPPNGRLYVAYDGVQPIGCGALRDLDGGIGEMKRMFVPVASRGKGVGLALANRLLSDAGSIGYKKVRLDTSWRQKEAIALYEKLGFKSIEPYYDMSEPIRNWLKFFEREI